MGVSEGVLVFSPREIITNSTYYSVVRVPFARHLQPVWVYERGGEVGGGSDRGRVGVGFYAFDPKRTLRLGALASVAQFESLRPRKGRPIRHNLALGDKAPHCDKAGHQKTHC